MPLSSSTPATRSGALVRVVKLKWFTDSLVAKKLLPIEQYTVYTATILAQEVTPSPKRPEMEKSIADEKRRREILERARRDGIRNREEDKLYADDYLRYRRRFDDGGLSERQRKGVNEVLALSKTSPGRKRDKRPSTPERDYGFAHRVKDMPKWVQENVCIFELFLFVVCYLPVSCVAFYWLSLTHLPLKARTKERKREV